MKKSEKTGSKLTDIPKDNPWKVPDNYFDTFSVRLNDRIHETETIPFRKKITLLKPSFIASYAAAVILAIVFLIFIKPEKPERSRLSESAIAANIEENIYYYSDETIIEALYEPEEPVLKGENFTEKEIIDYLNEEDADLDDLFNNDI